MNRQLIVGIVVSLLVGVGAGYFIFAAPSNNLEPVSAAGDPHGHGAAAEGDAAGHGGMGQGMGAGMGHGPGEEPAVPLADLEAALAREPNRPDLLVDVARAYRRAGRAADAKTKLEAALKAAPEDPAALFEMGVLHFHDLNDNATAIRFLEKYLAVAPVGEKADLARRTIETLRSGAGN